MAAVFVCLFTTAAFAVILSAFLIGSVSQLTPIEMGLKYNYILERVAPTPVTENGLYLLPFATLKKYPKTIQTMQFDKSDILDGRTSDGLPLILGASFQYRLDPANLYHLYHRIGEASSYLPLYRRVAAHLITEMATKFTAYQFFNEKQNIATRMRATLDEYFRENLYAVVESFQINEDDLPPAFYNAVLEAATTKQNITKTEKVLQATEVMLQTKLIQAHSQANQTIALAQGEASRILQEGRARASIAGAYIEADGRGYEQIRRGLGLEGESLLQYVWSDVLGNGGVGNGGKSVADRILVGAEKVFVGVGGGGG